MLNILKKAIGFINGVALSIAFPLNGSRNVFFLARFQVKGRQKININSSNVSHFFLNMLGNENYLGVSEALIFKSSITIIGNNNKVSISKGVKLRNSTLILRGDNCVLTIGSNTTFGGVRIVNTGNGNSISIGADCLFSDNVEVWSSDTHPIYDSSDQLINEDRPVVIENKVWVGSRVIILKGITIGEGSIVGMGSVVTKSIPSAVVSAGYPNKTIKENVKWKLTHNE